MLPVLLYGAKAWTLLSTDVATLRVFERIVLRKIFGPVQVGDDFRIRFNTAVRAPQRKHVVQLINILVELIFL